MKLLQITYILLYYISISIIIYIIIYIIYHDFDAANFFFYIIQYKTTLYNKRSCVGITNSVKNFQMYIYYIYIFK